jgi:hypothetical protein
VIGSVGCRGGLVGVNHTFRKSHRNPVVEFKHVNNCGYPTSKQLRGFIFLLLYNKLTKGIDKGYHYMLHYKCRNGLL